MKLPTLVWRELFERKSQMLTCFLAILAAITAVVAIQNVTFYYEKAVASEMDLLGANVLVLPKSATLQDYFEADMHNETIPESYVDLLTMSEIQGVDNLSPKLSVREKVQGEEFVVTGILPMSEFQAKASWGGSIFKRPSTGCGINVPGATKPENKETLIRNQVIETLGLQEVLVGVDVAAALGTKKGDSVELRGETFSVVEVLPQTGTIDDSRVFAHLHTVQRLWEKGEVVNCIEIVGCCKEISAGLGDKVGQLLDDTRVITIKQLVQRQQNIGHMMEGLSLILLGLVVVVGGSGIANYMYANVFERRREIGTLMALGAESSLVGRIFLLKALLLGLSGGIAGFLVGSILALILGAVLFGIGPIGFGVGVILDPWNLLFTLGVVPLATLITLAASYFPARRAARLDPCATLQEV